MSTTNTPHAETMRAIVCHGPDDYRLDSIDRPMARPGEVILKIGACGICASDVKCRSGAEMFWGGNSQPSWVKAPVVAGHEFFGEVIEMGEGAEARTGLVMGDRKELDVRGAHLSPRTFPVAIDLMARSLVTTNGIVTHQLPLADYEEGFSMAAAAESIKVLLIP
ncbi:MAG: alcohol dehydrogenase catalytic domain-containing protein [Salinisphaera sp.]|jgi:threonine dehydrogenase-like Zn-dependent dehydrogenase|nr:alcohol dehydrogenase catalytic domain-containing protein [Salinisphaera sp.]